MIKVTRGDLDLNVCQSNLDEFKALLESHLELDETGADSLQEFFDSRLNLLLLAGEAFGPGMWPTQYQRELVLLNEFRADYIVCDTDLRKVLFIEFEDAKENSIFEVKSDGKTGTSYKWASRFERGFSQIVDWHFRMDDYRRSSRIREHFGSDDIQYQGVLIIGRDQFLERQGTRRRFEWRVDRTVIDNRKIHCFTFDKLYREMVERLDNLKLVRSGAIT